jgi:hypothetical protein
MTAKEEINEKLRPRIMGMYGGFAFTFASVISASQLGKNAAFLIVWVLRFVSRQCYQFNSAFVAPFAGLKWGRLF